MASSLGIRRNYIAAKAGITRSPEIQLWISSRCGKAEPDRGIHGMTDVPVDALRGPKVLLARFQFRTPVAAEIRVAAAFGAARPDPCRSVHAKAAMGAASLS
jgi:hypothetical protein